MFCFNFYQPKRPLFLLALFVAVCCFSCSKQNGHSEDELAKQFARADSIISIGNFVKAERLVKSLRPRLHDDDPLLVNYYCFMAQASNADAATMARYADSALNFFSSEDRINKYRDKYCKALLNRGEAYFYERKYISALNYYFRCKQEFKQENEDEIQLASKIASIYYNQNNFERAAKYWSDTYQMLNRVNSQLSPQKQFLFKQGILNNTGLSFEHAGVIDSAQYYYNKDLNLINAADSNVVSQHNIIAASAVVYDNLGGLNASRGNFKIAKDYLTQALNMPYPDVDGMRVPPLLKMADIYLKTGETDKLPAIFKRSKDLINRYYNQNVYNDIKWNQLYAQYLDLKNQPQKAYYYFNRYAALKDSVQNSLVSFNHVDIERELNSIQQQQSLSDLRQKDKLSTLYTIGISIIALLSIAILFLIYGNLKRTTSDNQQLQNALADVEKANKNYIRIMRVMAHDIINPLAGITGLASTLLLKKSFSKQTKYELKLIESSGLHSMQMINELLKTGLADENEPIKLSPVDLRSLLYDAVELLHFKAAEKQQQIILETHSVPVMANVNPEKIWRVLNNIIVNAIKFSKIGGVIRVGLKTIDNSIQIYVADNGLGIADKDREHIFEMFTHAKRVGTNGEQPFGLGLSISKRIIDKHNGKIWFESKVGEGTIFYIELPIS